MFFGPPRRSERLGFFWRLNLHKLPAKAALDAEIAVGHIVIQRRCHLHDLAVLLMNSKVAAHAAVRTNRSRLLLALLVPCPGLPHLVFALEHQRARGTDANAIATIHAGRFRQWDLE